MEISLEGKIVSERTPAGNTLGSMGEQSQSIGMVGFSNQSYVGIVTHLPETGEASHRRELKFLLYLRSKIGSRD